MSSFRNLSLVLLLTTVFGWLDAAADYLPADQAFKFSAAAADGHTVRLSWDIADGYYLYRNKFAFVAKTPGASLGEAVLPAGETKHDENFGDVEIYRSHVDINLPLTAAPAPTIALEVKYQGCLEHVLCYPPQKRTVEISLPTHSSASGGLGEAMKNLGLQPSQGDLLPPDQAFRFQADVKDDTNVAVSWDIAKGYYLYRDKIQFQLLDAAGVRIGTYAVPKGTPKDDPEFGRVEVFRGELTFDLPLLRDKPGAQTIRLKARYQGCAERGVCYPPMDKTVELRLPEVGARAAAPVANPAAASQSEQDRIAGALRDGSWGMTILTFLGFGLLLAFTPCCFPMIPILSGIIVGHGHNITTRRAFTLSLVYVLASALTYTALGVLAGLFGANLQAAFQQTWVLVLFAGIFVALSFSMFGFYDLQLPSAIQSRLDHINRGQKSGTALGAAVMGVLSTLIVGPCVAAPLAGALIYIGQTGDALLGGVALFSLGFGSGIPLLAIGSSAGKLLPRAGGWMETTKAVFGVLLLGVAIWMLQRVLPTAASMGLWAMLLIVSAIYLGALDHTSHETTGWRRLWKGTGLAMLAYGVMLLIGVAADSRDMLQPLRVLAASAGAQPGVAAAPAASLPFQRVATMAELDGKLAEAKAKGQSAMVDYYADWCIACKEMEHNTFSDAGVRQALANVMLLQVDVTNNTDDDAALLKRYGLFGPPATLFYTADGQEKADRRVVGYMEPDRFLQHVKATL